MPEISENEKIKEMRREGFSYRKIAEEFNISESLVGVICKKVKIIKDGKLKRLQNSY